MTRKLAVCVTKARRCSLASAPAPSTGCCSSTPQQFRARCAATAPTRRPIRHEALTLARQGGNPSELAAALWAASLTAVHDAPSDALAFADESIALSRAGASGAALGHVLAIRAQLEARAGHGASAVADLQEAIIYSHDKGDQVMVMAAIDRGVSVLASLEEFNAAAVFVGIATTGATAILSITPRPERADREKLIAVIHSSLGTADYDAAAERGARMSSDDAVTYALTTLAEIADREL